MTRLLFCLAVLLGTAAPALAQQRDAGRSPPGAQGPANKAPDKSAKPKADGSTKNKSEEMDLAEALQMFEKIFPEQAPPPPERLALARQTAASLFPTGAYANMFDEVMSGMVDKVLALKPAEIDPKAKKDDPDANLSLRQQLAKDDPHFEERMRIMRKVIGEELLKLAAVVEPKVREGLARAVGRRFDERQLRELNAFLVTDTGRLFGAKSMTMWVDADVMRSFMQSVPDLITAMPGAMERLEKATAHLPKPPKKKDAPGSKGSDDEAEAADVS